MGDVLSEAEWDQRLYAIEPREPIDAVRAHDRALRAQLTAAEERAALAERKLDSQWFMHASAADARVRAAEERAEQAEDARRRITLATMEGEPDPVPVPWDNLATGVESLRNEWMAEFQRADAAEAERDQAIRERERWYVIATGEMEKAQAFEDAQAQVRTLREFVVHRLSCPKHTVGSTDQCTCGLDAALGENNDAD